MRVVGTGWVKVKSATMNQQFYITTSSLLFHLRSNIYFKQADFFMQSSAAGTARSQLANQKRASTCANVFPKLVDLKRANKIWDLKITEFSFYIWHGNFVEVVLCLMDVSDTADISSPVAVCDLLLVSLVFYAAPPAHPGKPEKHTANTAVMM